MTKQDSFGYFDFEIFNFFDSSRANSSNFVADLTSLILDLQGGNAIVTGSSNDKRSTTASNVFCVAVAVRASILT